MRETCGRLIEIRAARSREPAAYFWIHVCLNIGRSCKGSLNPLDRLCRNMRVVLGEMHDEWTIDARSEIECSVNSRAVIDDRAIGTRPSRSEIGKLPAVTEAQRADFARAFAAPTQCPNGGSNVRNIGSVELAIGAKYDITLGGVEIGDRLRVLIGFRTLWEQHQTRPAPRSGNSQIGI